MPIQVALKRGGMTIGHRNFTLEEADSTPFTEAITPITKGLPEEHEIYLKRGTTEVPVLNRSGMTLGDVLRRNTGSEELGGTYTIDGTLETKGATLLLMLAICNEEVEGMIRI